MLNITGAWRAEWLPNWILYGKSTVGPAPTIDKDSKGYYAIVGDSLFGGDPSVENVTTALLGIVEFNITRVPSDGVLQCALDMVNTFTFWYGPTGTAVDKHLPVRENGSYFIPELQPIILVLVLLVATTAGLASARIVKLKKNKETR
jgi:hypothetical protein